MTMYLLISTMSEQQHKKECVKMSRVAGGAAVPRGRVARFITGRRAAAGHTYDRHNMS